MPIRPFEKKRYPPPKEWAVIRAGILERAEDRCEFCRVPNGALIVADRKRAEDWRLASTQMVAKKKKAIKVVLTIAHLDHTPENNRLANLKALCQKCHNNYDRNHRAATRRKKGGS